MSVPIDKSGRAYSPGSPCDAARLARAETANRIAQLTVGHPRKDTIERISRPRGLGGGRMPLVGFLGRSSMVAEQYGSPESCKIVVNDSKVGNRSPVGE